MRKKMMLAAILGSIISNTAYAESMSPIVLELFTSQGCSSCPPADILLRKLSEENSQLLPLSFHVDYWNYLGWKDPYSTAANTDRQRGYASALDGKVYTPELIVNGGKGVVGSNERQVRGAIEAAQQTGMAVEVQITVRPDTSGWDVLISGNGIGAADPLKADILVINYQPYAQNPVLHGENGGRTLDHVNNVTGLKRLGAWQGETARYVLDLPEDKGDKTAILVQLPNYGRVIGAGVAP